MYVRTIKTRCKIQILKLETNMLRYPKKIYVHSLKVRTIGHVLHRSSFTRSGFILFCLTNSKKLTHCLVGAVVAQARQVTVVCDVILRGKTKYSYDQQIFVLDFKCFLCLIVYIQKRYMCILSVSPAVIALTFLCLKLDGVVFFYETTSK